jgi:adenylate cyclase
MTGIPLERGSARRPHRILIVDETTEESDVLASVLASCGYDVVTARSADEALASLALGMPDVVLLGVDAAGMDGYSLCRRIRENERTAFLPVVMITSKRDQQRLKAIEAGADDFIAKPFDWVELLARLRSLARLGAYHDQVEAQAAQFADWTRTLVGRVAEQVEERTRLERLRRFLSPQLADVVSSGSERLLESHRREITAVFCDLRGFTAFSEVAEPEEVMAVLRDYHAALGALVFAYEATLERFAGDGILAFFNDPVPCDDGTARAVRMAVEMRERVDALAVQWRRRGHDLGFGVGIALGYATMGKIGFEGRWDYGAVGSVVNLAARLCGEALARQILLSERAHAVVDELVEAECVGRLSLKGFREPLAAYNVIGLRDMPAVPAP